MGETKISKQYEFQVLKADEREHIVYGYFMISRNSAGEEVQDAHGHSIVPEELERASHNFISDSRRTGEMHLEEKDAEVVASIVFTPELQKALGIPDGILPVAWFGGVRIFDERLFEKIRNGELRMFSIQGKAEEETA